MDKNMINIDDFVRSRLSGAEEKEPPGAWSAMRDLLDKEMPVQPAAPFNWRRMLSYATALVVASSIGYGGYRMTSLNTVDRDLAGINAPAPNGIAANNTSKPVNTTIDNNAGTGNATHNTVTNAINGSKKPILTPATHVVANNQRATSAPATGNRTMATNGASASTNDRINTNGQSRFAVNENGSDATSANGGPSMPANSESAQATNEHFVAATGTEALNDAKANPAATGDRANNGTGIFTSDKKNNTTPKGPVKPKTATTAATHSSNNSSARSTAGTRNNATKPGEQGQAKHTSGKALAMNLTIPASGTNVPLNGTLPSSTGTTGGQSLAINKPGRVVDTIQQIEIYERRVLNPLTGRVSYQRDTISVRKIAEERIVFNDVVARNDNSRPGYLPESADMDNAKKAAKADKKSIDEVVPHSAIKSAKDVDNNSNNLVSLSAFKTSSKLTNLWDANKERFNLFLHNVNVAIDKARFYAGITGGFNTTVFSTNTLAGFQLGMNGLLVMNERWSMAAEFKYNHRFNGASINDNYSKVTNIVPGNESVVNGVAYREYSWDEDKVVHYYNFTAVQTLEAPVTLRYSVGRLFGEAGINMMYGFAINAEEVERPSNSPITVSRAFPVNNSVQENIGGGKHVLLSDFNSRFGLGYVLGAGYQITPALTTNFRLVQNVWDNASTDGGRKVSRNLYQTPSVQLSIGYRFSQGRRR